MMIRRYRFNAALGFAFGLALLVTAAAAPGRGQDFADVKTALVDYSKAEFEPHKTCDELGKFKSKDIAQIAAEAIASTDTAPAFCRVSGLLSPEIAFEVALPAKWNGRFYMIGNGGFAGDALDNPARVTQRNEALRLGFAFAQTNTGHDVRKEPGASFVMSNPQKAIDYAYRAVHLTAKTAKDITKDYYRKSISKAYWSSCSNGGRQGLIEAQRYSDDFDGVVANSPWVDQTGFTVGAMWNQKAVASVNLTPAKLALVAHSVMAKCDAIDGLKDGLIDDPRKCSFDPAARCSSVQRRGDIMPSASLPEEAAAIAKVYSGPISNGRPFFPGFMPGSEAEVTSPFGGGGPASGWMNVIVASQPGQKPADFNLADGAIRYLVPKPPQAGLRLSDLRLRP